MTHPARSRRSGIYLPFGVVVCLQLIVLAVFAGALIYGIIISSWSIIIFSLLNLFYATLITFVIIKGRNGGWKRLLKRA